METPEGGFLIKTHESPLEVSISGGSPKDVGKGIHLMRQLHLAGFLDSPYIQKIDRKLHFFVRFNLFCFFTEGERNWPFKMPFSS